MPNECMELWMSFDYVHDMIQGQVPLEFMFLDNFKLIMAMKVDQKMILKRWNFETWYVKKCMLLISKISVDHQVLHQGA